MTTGGTAWGAWRPPRVALLALLVSVELAKLTRELERGRVLYRLDNAELIQVERGTLGDLANELDGLGAS